MKSKRLCEAEQSALDKISTVPQPVLETILCLLPTDEAARTSVLSREWKYKWTKIPKLELHLSDVSNGIIKGNMDMPRDSFDDILRILLSHQCQIDEFTLHLSTFKADRNSVAFDQIIRHLSKNHTIKKFSIVGSYHHMFYKLPVSFFSLHQLTDLVLCSIDIEPVDLDSQPIFNGFDSLRTLCLQNVGISTETLLRILANSPSLKSLTLLIGDSHHDDRYCTVIELFNCLSDIEDLTTFGYVFEWLDLELIPYELPSLLHLKYLSFKQMCFVDGSGLTFLLVLIKCSPKLEKIKLEIELEHACEEDSFVWEDYSDVWLENLNELEIERFGNLEHEMKFVKFILSRSSNLKKVCIMSTVDRNQESEMLKTFSQASRLSPVMITYKHFNDSCFKDL
ncbi:hypothetical protein SSX86_025520 [Deinandra increscens subsp. villosa]|uniref:F-box domain-containing protein n=1 Tax=Deinandra increscens subsp. villosa TaxID=3103831 RepID=A0AAP0CIP7_9ASTR